MGTFADATGYETGVHPMNSNKTLLTYNDEGIEGGDIIERGGCLSDSYVQLCRANRADDWCCRIYDDGNGLDVDIDGVRLWMDYLQATDLFYCLRDMAIRSNLCDANPSEWDLREGGE